LYYHHKNINTLKKKQIIALVNFFFLALLKCINMKEATNFSRDDNQPKTPAKNKVFENMAFNAAHLLFRYFYEGSNNKEFGEKRMS
jgi:hypothetical protein